jgi:hypothetical protein
MPEITNDLMDMIAADDSASQISDKIKDVLYAKSAGRVDAHRPNAANSLFGEPPEEEADDEVNAAVAVAADEISGDAAAARESGEEE